MKAAATAAQMELYLVVQSVDALVDQMESRTVANSVVDLVETMALN